MKGTTNINHAFYLHGKKRCWFHVVNVTYIRLTKVKLKRKVDLASENN